MAGPVMQQAPTLQLGRGGMEGGGVGSAPQINPSTQDDGTFNLLMKMGETVLAPMIQKRQSDLFLQGAQRVAQGEALKDIVDEQPWYTQIFGESASIQGARTVAQVAQVDKFNAELMGNMDELAALSPEEVGATVNRKMQEFLTGDPLADAVIQQKMVEASGTFYTTHAKANYKYVQNTMKSQVTGMMIQSAGMFQQAARHRAEGTLSDKDWMQVEAKAASSLMPIAGQSQESYWGAVQEATLDALVTQNHHFVGMVFDSGLINEAPPEVRKTLIDERRKYEAITREEAGYGDFGAEIGVLKALAANGQISPKEVVQRVDQLNEQFSLRYGIKSPVFSRDEMSAMLTGNLKKLYSNQEAALKARAEGGNDQERALRLATVIAAGGGNMAVHSGLGTASEVQNAVWAATQAISAKGGDPLEFLVNTYNTGDGHVNNYMRNQMNSALRAATAGGEYNGDAFTNAYQLWRGMYDKPDGKAAAQAYLGDNSLRMEKFHMLNSNGTPPEIAFAMAFKEPLTKGRPVSNEEVQGVLTKEVESTGPGFIDRLLGHSPLTNTSKGLLASEIAKVYEPLVSIGVDEGTAIKRATDMAAANVDVLGPYAVRRNPGEPNLSALLGTDSKTAGKLFEDAVAAAARKQGVEGGIPGTGIGFTDIGPIGVVKRLIKGEKVDAIDATPVGVLSGLWNKTFSEDVGSQFINATAVMTDPESGLPYRVYSVYHTPADGSQPKMIVIDSRELRKGYEASDDFSD